ncbi:MAG: hypothetical protein GF398_12895 [Chitinivibrionales bacterium]|nr:hypothetical protein [Chitinivibrionales bacterium]
MARSSKKKSDRIDPVQGQREILEYLDKHGVECKDAGNSPQTPRRSAKAASGRRRPRITLDLHGATAEQAQRLILERIDHAQQSGIKELLIIHGKGYHSLEGEGPVLKTLVRQMTGGILRNIIRDWAPAGPREGGEGATIIRL